MSTDAETHEGLVIAARGRRGTLESVHESLPYIVKGRKLRVVCGDRVNYEIASDDNQAIVTSIVERTNKLERKAPGEAGTIEVLAANLSHIAVVCAPLPEPDYFLIDRYICAAEVMDCQVIVVANKSDLDQLEAPQVGEYTELGYRCISVSAATGAGLSDLETSFVGAIGILVGQSGAGKSSLVNALCPGADTTVASVSRATAEGKHTTTASTMRELRMGGRLIDTPGVREFIPVFDEPAKVATGYIEIRRTSKDCRFANCLHLREPGCAVKQSVANGRISARRYESYKRVIHSSPF